MNWWKDLKGKVKIREPLSEHTTFKIGGPAKFFIQPKDIADLKLLVTIARRDKIPIFVIGAGSNILVSDKGVEAVVLQLNSASFKRISSQGNSLQAGSGLALRQLLQAAAQQGLSGLEFLAGIPGTVGGALAMNAGAWARDIGDLVEKVRVMDYNGKIKILSKKEIKFGYRKSGLGKYIILSVWMRLSKRNKKEIKDDINKYLKQRLNTQDNSLPNAGCIFKNPSRVVSAGRLIDLSGLKGKKVGDACVSWRHANFILNRKRARACEILKLMDLIKKRVKDKFNLNLEPEIKIWQ